MSAKKRTVPADPNQPRCKHQIAWGQCACCRGKFGMMVIEIDRLFFSRQPPEFVGESVTDAIRKMRIIKEEANSATSRGCV